MSPRRTEEFIRDRPVGRLAMISDGEPYVVPLHYVMHEGAIYLHSAHRGRKMMAIGEGARVCLLVDELLGISDADDPCASSTYYRSAMIFGTAEPVTDPPKKRAALAALLDKYTGEDEPQGMPEEKAVADTAVLRLTIDELSGKECPPPGEDSASPDGTDGGKEQPR